jgi:hypothetical protein
MSISFCVDSFVNWPPSTPKICAEQNLLDERPLFGMDYYVCAEAGNAVEGRLRFADKHAKDVLHSAVVDGQFNRSGLAVLSAATCNLAINQDVCLQEGRHYAFQLNVPVGSIDKGVIIGFQVEGMFAAGDDEIGYVDASARLDVAQNSPKIIVRGKHAANAVKDAEVRLLEVVLALDGRLPWVSVVPWADFSVGTN